MAIEETLNVGNHVISGLGLKRADTYREIFQVLAEAKIISAALSVQLQDFATFRNRLVHLYWKISDDEFKAQLEKVSLLSAFAKIISKYAKRSSPKNYSKPN